jgi:hypothetical protein
MSRLFEFIALFGSNIKENSFHTASERLLREHIKSVHVERCAIGSRLKACTNVQQLAEDGLRFLEHVKDIERKTGVDNHSGHNRSDTNARIDEEIYYRQEIQKLRKALQELKTATEIERRELHEELYLQQLTAAAHRAAVQRYLPVSIYLDDEEGAADVTDAVSALCDALQLNFVAEYPAEVGSWFKRWLAKTINFATSDEVVLELEKLKRGVELKAIDSLQAKIDQMHASAAATLIGSLEGQSHATCQVGSLLIVKVPTSGGQSQLFTRTLTQPELIYLEKNQHLPASPPRRNSRSFS